MKLSVLLPYKISTNAFYARMHWTKRAEIVKAFRDEVFIAWKSSKMVPPHDFPVKMVYCFVLVGKMLDISNLSGMTKMIEDGLVACEALPDDTPAYVGEIIIRERRANKKSKINFVEIEIDSLL